MDAKGVEKQINDKIEVIGDTIASFLRVDSSKIQRILKKLNFYVYDNYYLQSDRLKNVDLKNIAKEYSSEVFDELDLPVKVKENLTEELSEIVLLSSSLDDLALNPIINKFVTKEEFSGYREEVIDNVKFAISNFLRDYETKDILSMISSGSHNHQEVDRKSKEIKRQLIMNNFNCDTIMVDWLWGRLLAFTVSDEELLGASEEYVTRIRNNKVDVYHALGASGSTLEEKIKSAKKKGIHVNRDIVLKMEAEYNKRFVKECAATLRLYTNVFDIYEDLKEKGYLVEDSHIVFLFNNASIYGVNFQVYGKDGTSSYIVFSNGETVYTSEFNDTCVHEIIHYLGGIDSFNHKRGLVFDDNRIYIDLEEAYVNALSKKVKDKVVKKSGNIVEPSREEHYNNFYDHTLEYMGTVFKYYLKPLSEIHLSSNISLKDANAKMPYDLIAKGVSRIMNADKNDVERYTKEEIEKIKQNIKKNKRN